METDFEEIAKGNFMQCKRGFYIFTSEESFASNYTQPVEMRKILWAKEILIGLFAGSKNTGGHTIMVSRIEVVPPFLKIFFEEIPPRPGMMVTQVTTFPGLLIAVKRSNLPIGSLTAEFITGEKVVKQENLLLQ